MQYGATGFSFVVNSRIFVEVFFSNECLCINLAIQSEVMVPREKVTLWAGLLFLTPVSETNEDVARDIFALTAGQTGNPGLRSIMLST